MIVYRLVRVCLHLFAGLWTSAFVFPFLDTAARDRRIKCWSIRALAICGMQVEVIDRAAVPAASHALIVANHISWLDIFVINTLHPCRFVAKSDIRGWPLIGGLSARAGTIFIARGKLREVRRIYENLVVSLHAGTHVAFFPEGTTAEQGTLLPFHSNLFEAAIEAQVPVQPYALRYVDASGQLHPAVTFVGDTTFAASMLTVLRARKITAELIRLPMIATDGRHRRELAIAAQDAIALALRQAEGSF